MCMSEDDLDELVITNFQIEEIKGISFDMTLVDDLSKHIGYYNIEHSFLKDFKDPYILYDGRFGLNILSQLNLESHIKEYLNTRTLYIFLYEDIETAVGTPIDLPQAIIDEDLPTILKAEIQYESTPENLETLHCYDFDYIMEFKNRNNLKKVNVCSNAYIPETLKQKYNKLNFSFHSPFLSEEARRSNHHARPLEELKSIELDTKFWCGNWRYTHHRHIIASYIVNKNTRMSWHYNGTFEDLNNGFWDDLSDWPSDKLHKLKQRVKVLNVKSPMTIDTDVSDFVDIDGNIFDLEKYPVVNNENINAIPYSNNLYVKNNKTSFCSIVTESRFAEHFTCFSEKPLYAINNFQPFILAGLPNTLKLFRKIGFKTFGDFWDESYDLETNHQDRLIKILDVIDYIDSFSLSELTSIRTAMIPILEYNYNLLTEELFDNPIYN